MYNIWLKGKLNKYNIDFIMSWSTKCLRKKNSIWIYSKNITALFKR